MKEDAPVQAPDGSEAVRQATSRLNELASGFRASQALYVAAEFGIADHLADRSLTSAELAKLCGTNCNALNRLMRALCAFGVFSESRSGGFSLTSVGRLLRSDIAESYRAGVLFMSGPVRWRCWSRLEDTTRTGVSQSDRLLGMPLFDFYASNPAESKIHDEAMRAFSASHAAALVKAIDINHAHLVVDIGGGTGELRRKSCQRIQACMGCCLTFRTWLVALNTFWPITASPIVASSSRAASSEMFPAAETSMC